MFFNSISLDFLFKLSIFALLIYKVSDIVKTVLWPFLNEQLILEKKSQNELINKEKLLFSSQQRIKNQILSQKQMFILLERNVQIWNMAKQEKHHAQEKENTEFVIQAKDRRCIQNNQLLLLSNTQSSLPIALKDATDTLTQTYATEAGKSLLTNMINQLINPSVAIQKKRV